MAALAVPLLIASTAVTAYSAHEQGKAAAEQAQFQSDQLKNQADLTAADGLRKAEEVRRQRQIEISNARAGQSDNGGAATDVSSVDQLGQLGGLFERNALEQIYGANLDAQQKRLQAGATAAEGASASRVGNIATLSTVLSGASSIYGVLNKPNVPVATTYAAGPSTASTIRRTF